MTRFPILLLLGLSSTTALAHGGEALRAATELPLRAQALRDRGVPASEVRQALRAGRDHGVPAGDLGEAFDMADAHMKEHGRTHDFGVSVQRHLDDGKRGSDLAIALGGGPAPPPIVKPGPDPSPSGPLKRPEEPNPSKPTGSKPKPSGGKPSGGMTRPN